MPIYVEARNVAGAGGLSGGHMYLVYVPDGSENDYAAWLTIGAFPEISAYPPGPWGRLDVRYNGVAFPSEERDDAYTESLFWSVVDHQTDLYLKVLRIEGTDAEYQAAYAAAFAEFLPEMAESRGRVLLYSAPDEGDKWKEMVDLGTAFDEQFSYKGATLDFSVTGPWPNNGDLLAGATVNSNSIAAMLISEVLGIDVASILPQPTPNIDPFHDDYFPGHLTVLGTANGESITMYNNRNAIYAGKGADVLYSNSTGSDDQTRVLVAGDDLDVDTMQAGSGDDILFGYYNQSDFAHSDWFIGGAGDNTFIVVDPYHWLPGGIPDTIHDLTGTSIGFHHQGNVAGGMMDGGEGIDTLDYRYMNGGVSVTISDSTIVSVERIVGTEYADTYYFKGEISGYTLVVGSDFFFLGGVPAENLRFYPVIPDTLDLSMASAPDGLVVTTNATDWTGEVTIVGDTQPAIGFFGVSHFVGSGGNDTFTMDGNGTPETVHGGGGNDTITGGPELQVLALGEKVTDLDDLLGGIGNDLLQGGDGADWLIDSEAPAVKDSSGKVISYNVYAATYDGMDGETLDGTGSDTLIGGKGADILVYTGGQDSFEGGEGDDFYFVTDQDYVTGDKMTIGVSHVVDDPLTLTVDESVEFGHDLVQLGDVDTEIVLNGLNSSDVTVTFEYEITSAVEVFANSDWMFMSLLGFEALHYHFIEYFIIGNVEITASDGSGITLAGLTGAYVDVLSGALIFAGSLGSSVQLQFDDGWKSLEELVLQDGFTSRFIPSAPISDLATSALTSFEQEREVITDTLTGGEDAEPLPPLPPLPTGVPSPVIPQVATALVGDGDNELLLGQGQVFGLFGGGGNDRLAGGAGGQFIDGGSGTDTADYSASALAVTVIGAGQHSMPTVWGASLYEFYGPSSGDADNDTLVSVENIIGSAGNDSLWGDWDLKGTVWGESGNDWLRSAGQENTLFGGVGDDNLGLLDAGGLMDGGEGNDTLTGTGGFSILKAGAGDDRLISSDRVLFTNRAFDTIGELQGTIGQSVMDGGDGQDTAAFTSSIGDVMVDMLAGFASFSDWGGETTFVNIENVEGGLGNDTLIGDDFANVLKGRSGNDKLFGGSGDDTLWGGGGEPNTAGGIGNSTGQDSLSGGIGIDTAMIRANASAATYAYADGGLLVTLAANPGSLYGEMGTVLISNDVEWVQFMDGGPLSYATLLQSVQTNFNVMSDLVRLPERQVSQIDVLANDLPHAGDGALHVTRINGQAITVGSQIRLASGATVTLLADGRIEFDQVGAFAWLDAGQSATLGLTYTATDNTGIEKTASLTVLIEGTDSNPAAYHAPGKVILMQNDPSGAAALRVENFDIAMSVIVWGETTIDPNAPPPGFTLVEHEGNTLVINGDDAIILDDVSLAAWQFVSAQRPSGTAGNDVLNGSSKSEFLAGKAGNDTIYGKGGSDVISGGAGNDNIIMPSGNALALGEDGHDQLQGGTGNDTLLGGSGNDTLTGNNGDDSLSGGSGDDVIYTGKGNDTIDGGSGRDTLFLYDSGVLANAPGAAVDLQREIVNIADLGARKSVIGIEDVYGTLGNDTLLGDDSANLLAGYGGYDLIYGAGGNDTLVAQGPGQLFGEGGDDRLMVGNSVPEVVDGGEGRDLLDAGSTTNSTLVDLALGILANGRLVSIEDVFAGSGNDTIRGDDGANILAGGYGNDVLEGRGGIDTLDGGAGNDLFIIDSTTDVIVESNGNGSDRVESSVTWTLGSNVENLTLTGAQAIDGTGNSLQNILVGNSADNVLSANGDNDILSGGGGSDTLIGGIGSDTITGGEGSDVYRFATGDGADLINDFDPTQDVLEINGVNVTDLANLPSGITGVKQGSDYKLTYGGNNTIVIEGTPQLRAAFPALFDIPGLPEDARALDLNRGQGIDVDDVILTGEFTIEAWVYFEPGSTIDNSDVLFQTTSGDFQNINFFGGRMRLYTPATQASTGGGWDRIVGATPLAIGQWQHIALTRDSVGILRVYVNGNLDATAAEALSANVVFGMIGAAAGNSDMRIDNLRVWDMALSSTALQAGMSSETPIQTGGLERQYSFDGVQPIIVDSTGNSSDAELSPGLALTTSTANVNLPETPIQGTAADDSLTGSSGRDLIDGLAGADSMAGLDGNDSYVVDNPLDIVVEGTAAGYDAVASSVTFTLGANVEDLVLTGSGAISGTGNELANIIFGNAAANTLFGMDGNDRLFGEDGDDLLAGGLGADVLNGANGDDSLNGDDGNDTLIGSAGNDLLDGGAGIDRMVGGTGDDIYVVDTIGDIAFETWYGGIDEIRTAIDFLSLDYHMENLTLIGTATIATGNGNDNRLTGNALANSLFGDWGNDTLFGGDGNDTLEGWTGADSMDGGFGDDIYMIDSSADVASEASGSGFDTAYSSIALWTMGTGIDALVLTGSQSSSGVGNGLANHMSGNDGSNSLLGMAGADSLVGGAGNDTLDGGADDDTLAGGADHDHYVVDSIGDVVVEDVNGGLDDVSTSVSYVMVENVENLQLTGTAAINGTGNALSNQIGGNSADNALFGGAGNDTLYGSGGDDTLNGGEGADYLAGEAGNDFYFVDDTLDTIYEALDQGTDRVYASVSIVSVFDGIEEFVLVGTGSLSMVGNSLANVMTGNSESNALSGGSGNDTISGLDGSDSLTGGTGLDVILGGVGSDTIDGGADGDLLDGGSENDSILGGSGNDTLDGGSGIDTLVGGSGNDLFIFDAAGDTASELTNQGTDVVQSSVTILALAANVENVLLVGTSTIDATGNSSANSITGNAANNMLSGGSGNDTLIGGAGNDTLTGGANTDSLVGGLGDDTYVFDAADTLVELAGEGTDMVQTSVTLTSLAQNIENITITSGTNAIHATGNTLANVIIGGGGTNNLTGGDGNDTLSGMGGNDTLIGGNGNDSLDGGIGNDSMNGGAGDDVYTVDSASDVIVESAGGGTDRIITSISGSTLGANVENVTLIGTAASVTGNSLANVINGNASNNTLSGGDGNDTLDGGAGSDSLLGGNGADFLFGRAGLDTLTGGTGADRFIFTSSGDGPDTITDFNQLDGGTDELDILVFEGMLVGTFAYRGDSAFTGGADNSEARRSGNQILVDTNGDGTTDISITLTGLNSQNQIDASDFLFT